MAASGNRYNIHYPDGTVERGVTLLGPMKQTGERLILDDRFWIVTKAQVANFEDQERDVHFEIHIRPAEA